MTVIACKGEKTVAIEAMVKLNNNNAHMRRGDSFMKLTMPSFVILLLGSILFSCRANCQVPPGVLADAHNPAGPPDPLSPSSIWHVDPLTGALTVHIPLATTAHADRGFVPQLGVSYNSSSTAFLQSLGIKYNYDDYSSPNSMACSDINNITGALSNCYSVQQLDPLFHANAEVLNSEEDFQWSLPSQATVSGVVNTGTWQFDLPTINFPYYEIPDQYYWEDVGSIPGFTAPTIGQKIFLGYGCAIQGEFIYIDENGAAHPLEVREQVPPGAQNITWPNNNPSYPCAQEHTIAAASSVDGSGILTTLNASFPIPSNTPTATVRLPNGTAIYTSSYWNITSIEDSNGNISTPLVDSLGRSLFQSSFTGAVEGATFNGPLLVDLSDSVGTNTITVPSPTGASEQYKITTAITPFSGFTMQRPTDADFRHVGWTGGISVPTVFHFQGGNTGNTISCASCTGITSISLPDQSAYQIDYDPAYGTISRITFPEGGYVRFVWNVNPVGEAGVGPSCATSTLVVTDAYVSAGSGEAHWSYGIPSLSYASCMASSITSTARLPDGTQLTYTGIPFIFSTLDSAYAAPSWLETSRLITNPAGALIESISTTYSGTSQGKPTQIATTIYDGATPLQKQIQYVYDSYSNIVEEDESDFYICAGSPCSVPSTPPSGWLRRTFTSYYYEQNAAWITAHIVNKPYQILVTDGSGNPVALTTYTYDEAGHIGVCPGTNAGCAQGIPTHDDANYGSNSTQPRGDVTTESRCISGIALSNSGNGSMATCGSSRNTSYYYDLTGQITEKSVASNGPLPETTLYYWGGQNSGFLQSVQYPVQTASDSYSYYPSTGQIYTHTDWNQQPTTYSYNDPWKLNRLSNITLPATTDGTSGASDQGAASFSYDDSPGAFSIQEHHLLNTNGTQTSVTKTLDGLGREITTSTQVAGSQCSNGVAEVETAYDGMGRVESVTTPYCSTSDPTYGVTTFAYDALGRRTMQCNPDNGTGSGPCTPGNSYQQWVYGGNAVTFTDEKRNPWKRTTDGLGRLIQVLEPSGASKTPTLETDYSYDVLGNLLKVNQKGNPGSDTARIVRTFSYDALSRLVCASNPENSTVSCPASAPSTFVAGTTGYAYDIIGNVVSKQDARGVITTYSYDLLNRLLGKTYTNDPSKTPTTCFQYGTAPLNGNFNGRLMNAWTQPNGTACAGSPQVGSYIALKSILGYDAVGRPTGAQQQQCIGSKCSGPTPSTFAVNLTYDLVGDMVSLTNSVGQNLQPLTLTSYYDMAAQPCLTTSSWAGNFPLNLFAVNNRTPFGGLQNWYLGSTSSTASSGCNTIPTSSVNLQQSYSNRLRITGFSASSGQVP